MRCTSLLLLLTGAACLTTTVPPPLKQAAMTLRWQAQLVRSGRRPCKLGTDVEIRENNKGRGLYALRDLESGTLVERYTGKLMSADMFDKSDSIGDYAMEMANGDVIDAADERGSSYVRFVNHSVRRANCEAIDLYREDSWLATVYLETIKPISAGDELLFDYGKDYWDNLGFFRLAPQRIVIDYF